MWQTVVGWLLTLVQAFRHVRKFLQLSAWSRDLSKRGQEIAERESQLGRLLLVEEENRSKITDLVRLEVERVGTHLREPHSYVEVKFTVRNHSIFDVAMVVFSSTVLYDARSTGIEIPQYTGRLEIPHQRSSDFSRQFPISDDFARKQMERKDQKQPSNWCFPISAHFEWPFGAFDKEEQLYWTGV